MPWAKLHSAWLRYGSPAAKKNGWPAHSSRHSGRRSRRRRPLVASRYRFGCASECVRYVGQHAAHHTAVAGVGEGVVEDVADREEDVLDQRRLQVGLVGEVLVERRRAHPEAVGEPPHGERLGALVVEDREGGVDDLAGACRPGGARAGARSAQPAASRRNTGWLGARASSTSSVLSASTPSKNWPTSNFQRRR